MVAPAQQRRQCKMGLCGGGWCWFFDEKCAEQTEIVMCHDQTDASISNHTNLLTTKIAFFVFFGRFVFPALNPNGTHDVFAADVIPCWRTFLRNRSKCSIIFSPVRIEWVESIEKFLPMFFFIDVCLGHFGRVLVCCSNVHSPHGIRVRYMRKAYCLTQNGTSSGRP